MTGAAVADVSLSGTASINYKSAEGGNEAVFSSDSSLTATMTNGGTYAASVGIGIAETLTTLRLVRKIIRLSVTYVYLLTALKFIRLRQVAIAFLLMVYV